MEMAADSVKYAKTIASQLDGKRETYELIASFFEKLVAAYHIFNDKLPEQMVKPLKMGAKWEKEGFIIVVGIPTHDGDLVLLEEPLGEFPSDTLLLQVTLGMM